MTPDHAHLRELAAGAALDDLDATERRELDAHIAHCNACAALSAELDDVLAELALAVPEVRPPVTMQADILGAIRGLSAPTALAPAGARAWGTGGQSETPRVVALAPRRRFGMPALAGLAAAAALGVVALGLGWRVAELGADLEATRSALVAEQAVVAVAANPDHRTAALHAPAGPTATVVYVPGGDAWFVSHNLPPTPEGRVYQLWHADGSGVHPLGTFTHDGEGAVLAPFGVDLAGSAAAMVTLEPVGGAQGEPGPEVVFGEL